MSNDPTREAFADLQSHRTAWRAAVETAISNASRRKATGNETYWKHELAAFDRTFAALAAAGVLDPPRGVSAELVVTGEMEDAFDNALPRRENARHPNDRDKPLYDALADGYTFEKAFRAALAVAPWLPLLNPSRGDSEEAK